MFSHFNPETIALLTGVQKDVLREPRTLQCSAGAQSAGGSRLSPSGSVRALLAFSDELGDSVGRA